MKVTKQTFTPAALTLPSLFMFLKDIKYFLGFMQWCHVRKTRLRSSRAKQVMPTVYVGDTVEGEGEESCQWRGI